MKNMFGSCLSLDDDLVIYHFSKKLFVTIYVRMKVFRTSNEHLIERKYEKID
jgi:hypothetical protein